MPEVNSCKITLETDIYDMGLNMVAFLPLVFEISREFEIKEPDESVKNFRKEGAALRFLNLINYYLNN